MGGVVVIAVSGDGGIVAVAVAAAAGCSSVAEVGVRDMTPRVEAKSACGSKQQKPSATRVRAKAPAKSVPRAGSKPTPKPKPKCQPREHALAGCSEVMTPQRFWEWEMRRAVDELRWRRERRVELQAVFAAACASVAAGMAAYAVYVERGPRVSR